MGGPKGHQRGGKTHRADQLKSRGAREEPQPEGVQTGTGDPETEGRRQEAEHERPTGRMTERGHRAGPRGGYTRSR